MAPKRSDYEALEDAAILKRCDSGALKEKLDAISGIACQNAAFLAAICDLQLRFGAATGDRGAIWELA